MPEEIFEDMEGMLHLCSNLRLDLLKLLGVLLTPSGMKRIEPHMAKICHWGCDFREVISGRFCTPR
jgi:hypothetical protein